MIDPKELITVEAGVVLQLLDTVKRLHMGAETAGRYERCPTCQVVTGVETMLGISREPPPVPRPKLRALPAETE